MPSEMEFFNVQRTRSKKTQVLLRIDSYDYERLEELPPHDVTVQTKLRQIVKMFLDGGLDEPDDLEGL